MADFQIPSIDDTVIINGEVLRVVALATWEDDDPDGEHITSLDITCVKTGTKVKGEVPDIFKNAFEE